MKVILMIALLVSGTEPLYYQPVTTFNTKTSSLQTTFTSRSQGTYRDGCSLCAYLTWHLSLDINHKHDMTTPSNSFIPPSYRVTLVNEDHCLINPCLI